MPQAVTISLTHYRKAGQVAAYLEAMINDGETELPSVGELCRLFMAGESVLSRAFKRRFGLTIHAFIINRKMERGKQLLSNKDCTVKEIAQQLGYTELSNFSRDFSKLVGMSPSAFRQHIGA